MQGAAADFFFDPGVGAHLAPVFNLVTGDANNVGAGLGRAARDGLHRADIAAGQHGVAGLAEQPPKLEGLLVALFVRVGAAKDGDALDHSDMSHWRW